jgi:hypothetical protein
LTQVSSFGSNPAGLKMYIYVPDAVVSSPGVVVTLHGASGNAAQQFSSTPYAALAEQYGFIVVYPESPQGAWDATSTKSRTHEGGGASQSIANMAKYALSTYKGNANKVFASGVSSGGTMAVSRIYHTLVEGWLISLFRILLQAPILMSSRVSLSTPLVRLGTFETCILVTLEHIPRFSSTWALRIPS